MQANIGRTGRAVRAVSGFFFIVAGLVIWLTDWPASITLRCVITAATITIGAFQVYEARKSWCVARACGIKTPL